MGKFHDDGTLEIGGFGGEEIAEESVTVSEMDALKREVKRLKLMIGKEQTFGRNHYTGTEVAKIDNGILQAATVGIIQLLGGKRQA